MFDYKTDPNLTFQVVFSAKKKTFNVILFCKLIRELKNPRVNPLSVSQIAI